MIYIFVFIFLAIVLSYFVNRRMNMKESDKREKRAMSRIRKRNAELALMSESKSASSVAEEDEDHLDFDAKKQKITTQGGSGPIAPSANPIEIARILSLNIRNQRSEQEPQQREARTAILQLQKLQGRHLSERELAAFLHKMMLGSHNAPRVGSNWIRFEGGKKPLQIVLVRVNCADKEMLETKSSKYIGECFGHRWLELHKSILDRRKFWQAISTVVQSSRELLIRKIKTSSDPLLKMRVPERKAQFLMSLEQMVESKFPFPTEQFGGEGQDHLKITATRKMYRKVTERSPIFVMDCEMCMTSIDRLELTRIAVLDEHGRILMDKLVKPYNKITDYITHKSGITKAMLQNVTVRLKDIQKELCAMLTDDAILCGHSLENDLMALQLSHPFCIDTSLHFNFSGRLHIRSGLKALTKIFLNEDIQESKEGHCSLEDARATLKLLQLKLDKGIIFGNAALGWAFNDWAKANGMTTTGTRIKVEAAEESGIDGGNISISSRIKNENGDNDEKEGEYLNSTAATDNLVGSSLELTDELSHLEEQEMKADIIAGQSATTSGQNELSMSTDESFDFSEAVRIDNFMQKSAHLSDCFNLVNNGKRARKMLVAIPDAGQYFQANESCTLTDISSAATPMAACSNICSNLLKYDFVLMELNCTGTAETQSKELDQAMQELANRVCNNGMLMCILSVGNKKDGRAIMYQKINRK